MMLERLGDVDWRGLVHAYGDASRLPDTLRRAASDDSQEAEDSIFDLFGTIYHQGSVYSSTAPAVPFLYELVADAGVHHRPKLLELLSVIAGVVWDLEGHSEEEYDEPDLATVRGWAENARAAVEDGVPTLISLLDDGDPAVRAAAAFVIADFPQHETDLASVLQEKAPRERDPGAAASIVLAVGDMTCDRDAPPVDWLTEWFVVSEAPDVRAAAGAGLLWCGVKDLPEGVLEALTEVIKAPESALDGQLWVLDGGRAKFLSSALEGHPAAQIQVAREALATFDARKKVDAIRRAGEVMRTWRAAPAALLPGLAQPATDEDRDVREAAVWEIKQGGPAVALVADALSALLTDPEEIIAGSALEALARAGEERCLSALVTDLAEPKLAFNPAPAIAGMADHVDELLPHVHAYLREPNKGSGFAGNYLVNVLKGVHGWGAAALPLLPDLISLLEQRKAVPAVARVLGVLGTAAADSVPLLRGYLGRKHGRQVREQSAWALWRITGEAQEPLRVLTPALRERLEDEMAEHLFDLGAAAEPAVRMIEPLLDDERSAGAAACVIYRSTADVDRTLPYLLDTVAATPVGMLAVRCLADIGPDGAEAIPTLEEMANSDRVQAGGSSADVIVTDLACQDLAATALSRIRS
jgi:HEAT repeat protein